MKARTLHAALVASVLAWTSVATADGERPTDDAGGHPFELHLGSFHNGGLQYRPTVCVAGGPWTWLSIEACGTGTGFLHHDPIPEIAHFRAKLRVATLPLDYARLQWLATVGFGELQVAADAPGFEFRRAQGKTATSGPEAGAALRLRLPRSDALDLLLDARFTLGWYPHAGELTPSAHPFQPSGSLTMGVGF